MANPLSPLPRVLAAAGPVLGGIYAGLAGLRPTGEPTADVVWSVLFGGTLAFVASRANPALWVLCSSLTVLAVQNTALVAGYGLALLGLWSISRNAISRAATPKKLPPTVGMGAGLLVGPLLFGLGDLGYPGASAALSAAAFVTFALAAIVTSDARTKRLVVQVTLVATFGLALLGFISLSFVNSLQASVNDTEVASRTTVSVLRLSLIHI